VVGKFGCFSTGFVMYTAGLMQILLITAVSIERYLYFFREWLNDSKGQNKLL
jgi:hypothetical protein